MKGIVCFFPNTNPDRVGFPKNICCALTAKERFRLVSLGRIESTLILVLSGHPSTSEPSP